VVVVAVVVVVVVVVAVAAAVFTNKNYACTEIKLRFKHMTTYMSIEQHNNA